MMADNTHVLWEEATQQERLEMSPTLLILGTRLEGCPILLDLVEANGQ